MLINRRLFKVKNGRAQEAAALMKAESVRMPFQIPYRVSTGYVAPFGYLCWEGEFESLAEFERFWAEWDALPTTPAFFAKWYELTDVGGTNEIWKVIE